MDCNCNNICGGKNITAPKIKHVYGNVLRIAIPLTLRSLVKDGDTMVATDTEFIPSADYPVIVAFLNGKHRYAVAATMDGNVAVIEDNGKIPIGTYDITVECRDDIGRPYRFAQATVLRVVDRTAEADIDAEIEYEARLWYLDAAVFLATAEIGSMSEEIDRKLEDVFGYADYDARNKVIQFYNKDRTSVLTTMDASPFVADGSVADVYIDVARQVLVVVNNADSGGRIFNVPLYLIFNSYYNKEQVEDKIAQAIDGIEVDTSGLMRTAEFTNSAEQGMPMGGVITYAKTARTALDFIDGIGGVHGVAYGIIYGSTDGRIMGGKGNYGEADLGGAADHVFLNKDNGLLYTYENDEWVQVGGSGSGVDVDSTWVENSTNPVESQLVKSELDSLSASIEALDAQLNPYTLSLSASSALLEYTGSAQNVTFTPTMKRGSTTITPDSVSVTCNSTTMTSSPYTFSLTNRNSYTANATATKDGTTKTASASVKVMHRMRIGFATGYAAILADSNTKQSLKNSVSGTYTATNGNADNYLWICVDATLSVSTVKSSGFDVPMETAVTTDGYKCYRSSEKIATGEMTIEIS